MNTTPDTLAQQVAVHRAHVIAADDEALAVVQRIAPRLARESAERDAQLEAAAHRPPSGARHRATAARADLTPLSTDKGEITMATIVILAGNPSATSRTAGVLDLLALRLTSHGHKVRVVLIRELPPGPLLAADAQHPAISDIVEAVDSAHGLIVASPVYKAAYTGLLKSFLDLLSQYALAGKTVLPLVTGGTPAHVLAVDYALRPVLASMGAHVGQGYFLLDQLIGEGPGGDTRIAPGAERPLLEILDAFSVSLAFRPVTVPV